MSEELEKTYNDIEKLQLEAIEINSQLAEIEVEKETKKMELKQLELKRAQMQRDISTPHPKLGTLSAQLSVINGRLNILQQRRKRLENIAKMEFQSTLEREFVEIAKLELSKEDFDHFMNYAFKNCKRGQLKQKVEND